MKYLAPLFVVFALVEYTTPNGHPIFINRDAVVAVTQAQPYDCKDGAGSKVITTTGYSCVQEIPPVVVQRLLESAR